MTEHETCKGCKWNSYPICLGMKMNNGQYMNIEKLRPVFNCGQKNESQLIDYSIKLKTETELKIEELESRIQQLEEVKK